MKTVVEILDSSRNKIAEMRNLYPINKAGMILRYSDELSDYGSCTFRVSTREPALESGGDILQPHQNHIRIKRDQTTVWQGLIIDNPERNKNYIEVKAVQYEFYLTKILIRRDTTAPTGADTSTDSWKNYRTFQSGTMSSAINTLITDAVADVGSQQVLGGMTAGTIENPDYPSGFVNSSGTPLTGGWTFSDYITLRFDYHTVAYVLDAFGVYTNADYYIDNNLQLHFKKFLGTNRQDLVFRYGTASNIIDYNLPRLGGRMINRLWGIAADEDGTVLHSKNDTSTSISTYGLMMGVEAFGDVKTNNELKKRISESLKFTATPEDSPVNIILNEKSYPHGTYDVGDIVTVKIKDHNIDFNAPRRIVGITVQLHNTGREIITVQTNKPDDNQLGV